MTLLLVSTERERPEVAVQAYHVLLAHHRPDARLLMVGTQPSPQLREYVRQLSLHGLAFVEDPPPEAAGALELRLVGTSPLLTAEAVVATLEQPVQARGAS